MKKNLSGFSEFFSNLLNGIGGDRQKSPLDEIFDRLSELSDGPIVVDLPRPNGLPGSLSELLEATESILVGVTAVGGASGLLAWDISRLLEDVSSDDNDVEQLRKNVDVTELVQKLEQARGSIAHAQTQAQADSSVLFDKVLADLDTIIQEWKKVSAWTQALKVEEAEVVIKLRGLTPDLNGLKEKIEALVGTTVLDSTIALGQQYGYKPSIASCGHLELTRGNELIHYPVPGDVAQALSKAGVEVQKPERSKRKKAETSESSPQETHASSTT